MSIVVSVVIPAYNVAFCIRDCLESLRHQSFPVDRFEVIVVDDGSTDTTLSVVQQIKVEWSFEALTIVHQPNAGPAAARNHGIRLAKGDIIAFLDSDCIPTADWLEALIRPFREQPDLVGVEGKTLPASGPRTLIDHYVLNEHGGLCWTCNIAYRKSVLVALGGFDEGFPWPSGEDIDIAHRVRQVGDIRFAPEALVHHLILKRSFWKHVHNAKTFSSMLRLHRKHPGLLCRSPGFGPIVCFQFIQLLFPIITQRRECPKAPLAYLQFCLIQILMALDTLIRLPFYYQEAHRPLVVREPLRSPGVAGQDAA